MRIQTGTQQALFRDTMESLVGLAPILRRWDLNGSQTYGLAALATAWEELRGALPGLPAARHRAGVSTDDVFKDDLKGGLLSRDSDALFFLLDLRYPAGSDDAAHRQLRAWALLRAVHLLRITPAADKNLSRVCQDLAKGAVESGDRVWRECLLPLGRPVDRFEDLNKRLEHSFNEQRERIQWRQPPDPKSAQYRFLAAARSLAKGEVAPFGTLDRMTPAPGTAGIQGLFFCSTGPSDGLQLLPLSEELSIRDGELPTRVDLNLAPKDRPAEEIQVNPQKTVHQQDAYVRSVRFQLGAAARFLPWSWHQLNPPEIDALHRLLAETLETPNDALRHLLAALASIAVAAGQSPHSLAELPIASEIPSGADWSLDLSSGHLLRRPPRHPNATRIDKYPGLVIQAAEALEIPLHQKVHEALSSEHRAKPDARRLGDLWDSEREPLRTALVAWLQSVPALRRVTPGMLAHLAGQSAFQATRDHVLARLVSSDRSDALPPSATYTALRIEQLAAAYPNINARPEAPAPLNGGGSILESSSDTGLEDRFAVILKGAVDALRSGNWLQFHNLIALHWDTALRVATGARPVGKLWPSLDVFDWNLAAVYLDEKESPIEHNGRLVPLPVTLCQDFKRLYVDQHLPWVFSKIAESDSGPDKRNPPGVLFTIEEEYGGYSLRALDGDFRRTAGGTELPPPLPTNFLRHRLRTRLHRERDVDLEIVDSIIGHGDGCVTRTHGAYSMRIWQADAEAIRPALTRLFNEASFMAPPLWPSAEPLPSKPTLPIWLLRYPSTLLDKEARERSRRTETHKLIEKFLAEERALEGQRAGEGGGNGQCDELEPPSQQAGEADSTRLSVEESSETARILEDLSVLSEEQFDRLSRSLSRDDRDENDMPSAIGNLRYEELLKIARDCWDLLGRRIPIRKRYSSPRVEPSTFNSKAPGSVSLRLQLLAALDQRFQDIRVPSRLRPSDELGLVALDLALVSRISCADLICNVIENDSQWRVVRLDESFYIEWSPSDDLVANPRAPVERFSISLRCAWLLSRRIRGKTRRSKAWLQSNLIHEIAASSLGATDPTSPTDPISALRDIAAIVDQSNAIELPGSVAAYLGQRLLIASLPWGDWIRLHKSQWMSPRYSLAADPSPSEPTESRQRLTNLPLEDEEDFALNRHTSYQRVAELSTRIERNTNDRATDGHALVAEVRKLIADIAHSQDGPKYRDQVATAISRRVDARLGASSAIRVLCLWANDLLLRPGRSRKLATSSVLRYFGALSPRFTAIGYEVDLLDHEAEDIEAFYLDVLDGANVQDQTDIYDALRNFHAFASASAGVSEIDWSSIAFTARIDLGSPGFIDEASYLLLLDRLKIVARAKGIPEHQLIAFAVFAYRFGLRGGEIEGLRRDDLIYPGAGARVLVQNNRIRSLKTSSARRIVPLLFKLTSAEHLALTQLIDFHSGYSVNKQNGPLFLRHDNPMLPADGPRLRALINAELKLLTGQPHASMHKLRKSFAISLWSYLEAPHFALNGVQSIDGESPRALIGRLLGTPDQQLTRRSSWAIAVVLGHAHPSTSLRSYLPVVSDVASAAVSMSAAKSHLGLRVEDVCIASLQESLQLHVPPAPGSADALRPASATDILCALLFLNRGVSASATSLRLDIPLEVVDGLARDSEAVCSKLVLGDKARLEKHADSPDSARLASSGLLALVHVRGHERIHSGLAVSTRKPFPVGPMPSITTEHLTGMVGGRRQISMWQKSHFQLGAFTTRLLVNDRRRLQLEIPKGSYGSADQARLEHLARAAGWLPNELSDGADPMSAHLCNGLAPATALPRVRLDDEGIDIQRRVSLRLLGNARQSGADVSGRRGMDAADSLELVVGLVCVNALARWSQLVSNSSAA